MKTHISHKELLAAFLDENRQKHAEVFAHLDACGLCASEYASIKKLFAPRDNSSVQTSARLDYAVARAARNWNIAAVGPSTLSKVGRFTRSAFTYAAACAVFAVSLLIFINDRQEKTVSFATLHGSGGQIVSNNSTVTGTITLQKRTVIKTGTKTFAHIRFKDESIITIGENSSLEIINKDKPIASFIHLKKGTIYCKFAHKNIDIVFTLKTPQAYIDTIGTEFYLSSTAGRSSLILTEGKVRVKTAAKEQLLSRNSGKKYLLDSSIAMARVSAADKTIMESFTNYNAAAGLTKQQVRSNSIKKTMRKIQSDKREVRERMRETRREMRKNMRNQRKEMNKMKRHMKKEKRQHGKKN